MKGILLLSQRYFPITILMIILLAACRLPSWANNPPGQNIKQVDFSKVECLPRADDPEGYLLSICEYVLENDINTSPADPSQFNIKEMGEQTQDGREVLVIFLDCCGMGDRAILHADTGEVLEYHLGDY